MRGDGKLRGLVVLRTKYDVYAEERSAFERTASSGLGLWPEFDDEAGQVIGNGVD